MQLAKLANENQNLNAISQMRRTTSNHTLICGTNARAICPLGAVSFAISIQCILHKCHVIHWISPSLFHSEYQNSRVEWVNALWIVSAKHFYISLCEGCEDSAILIIDSWHFCYCSNRSHLTRLTVFACCCSQELCSQLSNEHTLCSMREQFSSISSQP